MKMWIVAAAAVALAPAMAQAQAVPAGLYANLGYAHSSDGGLHLGAIQGKLGYRAKSWLGVEAEAAFGVDDDTVSGVKVDLKHEFAAYVVGFAPINADTDLFARIGYGTTKLGASASGVSTSASDESINLGVGAQHFFDANNGVRIEYLRQEFDDGGDADVWGVSYTRRF